MYVASLFTPPSRLTASGRIFVSLAEKVFQDFFFFLLSNQSSLADVTPLEISPQSFKWIDWEELYLHSSALSRANHIWIMAAEWNIKAVCIPACLLPIHLCLWCIRGRRKKKPTRVRARARVAFVWYAWIHTRFHPVAWARERGRGGWWGDTQFPYFSPPLMNVTSCQIRLWVPAVRHNGTGSERIEHNSIAHAEEEKTGCESVASRHLLPASVKSGSISSNHCSVLNLNVLTNMAEADAI